MGEPQASTMKMQLNCVYFVVIVVVVDAFAASTGAVTHDSLNRFVCVCVCVVQLLRVSQQNAS